MRPLIPKWVFVLAVVLLPATASAQMITIVDYYGYGWETGGFLPSDPGDVLEFSGVADFVNPLIDADLGTYEVTLYFYDLVSTGEFVDGGTGNTFVSYAGGTLEVYRDAAKNADWGVFPPNATSPSTFMDGTLLFQGSFTSFNMVLTPSGAGAYEGLLDGIAGLILSDFCDDCAYTWGGSFTQDTGAQIPDGYDLQLDGVLELDQAVPAEPTAWGALKALYKE